MGTNTPNGPSWSLIMVATMQSESVQNMCATSSYMGNVIIRTALSCQHYERRRFIWIGPSSLLLSSTFALPYPQEPDSQSRDVPFHAGGDICQDMVRRLLQKRCQDAGIVSVASSGL